MEGKPIRVFFVDDHAMFRGGMAAIISGSSDFDVVGNSSGGPEALGEILACMPDVAVLDITLQGASGLDLCRAITQTAESIGVLMLTMHDDEVLVARALEYGACGYLLKESAPEEFTRALRSVAKHEIYLGPGISSDVLRKIGTVEDDPYESLTTRERQVLQLVVAGKTTRQIADELSTAVKTVEMHRMHLMRKLGLHDQTSLVKFAIRKGLVQL